MFRRFPSNFKKCREGLQRGLARWETRHYSGKCKLRTPDVRLQKYKDGDHCAWLRGKDKERGKGEGTPQSTR